MKTKKHTYLEQVRVLEKQTLTLTDIRVIFDCGYQKAKEWSDGYFVWYSKKHGHAPYGNQIFTGEFIEFSGWDERRLYFKHVQGE